MFLVVTCLEEAPLVSHPPPGKRVGSGGKRGKPNRESESNPSNVRSRNARDTAQKISLRLSKIRAVSETLFGIDAQ